MTVAYDTKLIITYQQYVFIDKVRIKSVRSGVSLQKYNIADHLMSNCKRSRYFSLFVIITRYIIVITLTRYLKIYIYVFFIIILIKFGMFQ